MTEKRALIIDDDNANCFICGHVLSEHGYDVRVAFTLDAAMNSIEPDVQLYLVDYYLPDGTGTNAVSYIRQNFPESVVFTTSMDDDSEVIREAMAAGSNVYLVKPTSPNVIGELLDEIDSGALNAETCELISRNGRRAYNF